MVLIKELLSKVNLDSNKPYFVNDGLCSLSLTEFFEGVNTVYVTLKTCMECFGLCLYESLGFSPNHVPIGLFLKRSAHLSAVLFG